MNQQIEKIKEDKLYYENEKDTEIGCLKKSNPRRAILIITENISQLKTIHKRVSQEFSEDKNVQIYNYDRAYQQFKISHLKQGDIIIATNIAGRGTDLDISSQVEDCGGLHVILAYIPNNIRIQKQAFGRTARSGNKGTGTFIVHESRLENDATLSIIKLQSERDEAEYKRLNDILKKQLPKISLEDKLFSKFKDLNEYVLSFAKNKFSTPQNQKLIETQQKILRNKWAIWLNFIGQDISQIYSNDDNQINNIEEKYDSFVNEIKIQCQNNEFMLAKGPGELLLFGTNFMILDKINESTRCFEKIINENYNCSAAALYYKSYCVLKKGGGDNQSKIQAKSLLKKALHLMNYEKEQTISRSQFLNQVNNFVRSKGRALDSNEYQLQNEGYMKVLDIHINCVNSIIGKEVEKESFSIEGLSQLKSEEIFDVFIKDRILKDFRISKKVQISNDGKNLQIKNQRIILPRQLLYGQQKLINLIINKSKGDQFQNRIVNPDYFEREKGLLYTKEQFEFDTKDVIVKKIYIEVNPDVQNILIGKLDEEVYQGKGQKIKEFLLDKQNSSSIVLKSQFEQNLKKQILEFNDIQIQKIMHHLENYESVLIDTNNIEQVFKNQVKNKEIFFENRQKIYDFLVGNIVINIPKFGEILIKKNQKNQFYDKSLIVMALKQVVNLKNDLTDEINFQALLTYIDIQGVKKQAIQSQEYYEFIRFEDYKKLVEYDKIINLKIKNLQNKDIEKIKKAIKHLDLSKIISSQKLQNKIIQKLYDNIGFDKNLDEQYFELKEIEFDNLKILLEENKIIKYSFVNCLFGREDFANINQDLEQKIMMMIQQVGGKLKIDDSKFINEKSQGKIIFDILRSLKLIKEVKVNYNPEIKGKIEKIIKERFPEIEVKNVKKVIKEYAGKLKTVNEPDAKLLDIRSESISLPPQSVEFVQIGFYHIIQIEKKMNWVGTVMVSIFGLLQIVAGAAIIVLSHGSLIQIGSGLVSEGISDIVFAAQCMIQGQFRWKEYGQHKLQSLMMTILFCGAGSIFGNGLQQGADVSISGLRSIVKVIGKQVVQQLIGAAFKQGTSFLSEKISQEIIEDLKNFNITEKFEEWSSCNNEIKKNQQELEQVIRKMYNTFGSQSNIVLQGIFEQCYQNTIKGTLLSQILSKAPQLLGGLTLGLEKLGQKIKNSTLSTISQVVDFINKKINFLQNVNSLQEIFRLSNNIYADLIKEIRKKHNQMEQELQNSKKRDEQISQIINEKLNIDFDKNTSLNCQKAKDLIQNTLQETIRKAFVSPQVIKIFQKSLKPLQDLCTLPFKNSMEKVQQDVEESINQFKEFTEQDGPEILNSNKEFSSRQVKALQHQLGILPYGQLKSQEPYLASQISAQNFSGMNLEQLEQLYGPELGIYQKDGKYFVILPTFNQFCNNMTNLKLPYGDIQVKILSEILKIPINIVDENQKVINSSTFLTNLTLDRKVLFKIKYIPPDKNNEESVGHYIPMIQGEDGKYQEVNIPQIQNDCKTCLPQAVLFLKQYYKNKDENKSLEYSMNLSNIQEFVKQISDEAKRNKSFQNYFNYYYPINDKEQRGVKQDIENYKPTKQELDISEFDQFERQENQSRKSLNKVRIESDNIRNDKKNEINPLQLANKDPKNLQEIILFLNNDLIQRNQLHTISNYAPNIKDGNQSQFINQSLTKETQ